MAPQQPAAEERERVRREHGQQQREHRQRPLLDVAEQELRRRGVGALKEMLSRMADAQRVIIAIDDVQWGDADSAALRQWVVARRPSSSPA